MTDDILKASASGMSDLLGTVGNHISGHQQDHEDLRNLGQTVGQHLVGNAGTQFTQAHARALQTHADLIETLQSWHSGAQQGTDNLLATDQSVGNSFGV